ncbi:hypothetical protein BOX15_Mlig026582g2, partial [Macrostomum lignano]
RRAHTSQLSFPPAAASPSSQPMRQADAASSFANGEGSAAWEAARRRARQLESALDRQLVELASCRRHGGGQEGDSHDAEVERLLAELEACHQRMAAATANTARGSWGRQWQLQRHRDTLDEYRREWLRIGRRCWAAATAAAAAAVAAASSVAANAGDFGVDPTSPPPSPSPQQTGASKLRQDATLIDIGVCADPDESAESPLMSPSHRQQQLPWPCPQDLLRRVLGWRRRRHLRAPRRPREAATACVGAGCLLMLMLVYVFLFR